MSSVRRICNSLNNKMSDLMYYFSVGGSSCIQVDKNKQVTCCNYQQLRLFKYSLRNISSNTSGSSNNPDTKDATSSNISSATARLKEAVIKGLFVAYLYNN